MAKIGDTVRFLNSTGGGRIARIEGNIAYVEDNDGFEVPALLKECVVVMEASAAPEASPKVTVPVVEAKVEKPELPKIETPEGDSLNVVVAFEPTNLKSLSNSQFDAVLVNDSNYYLNFAFATRAEDETKWTLRRAGIVEPNIVLTLCSLEPSQLNAIDRMLVQFVAYKDDKGYDFKMPVSSENRIDNTKFFKLHCFKNNPYFDQPVIAIDIVKDDRQVTAMTIDRKSVV